MIQVFDGYEVFLQKVNLLVVHHHGLHCVKFLRGLVDALANNAVRTLPDLISYLVFLVEEGNVCQPVVKFC